LQELPLLAFNFQISNLCSSNGKYNVGERSQQKSETSIKTKPNPEKVSPQMKYFKKSPLKNLKSQEPGEEIYITIFFTFCFSFSLSLSQISPMILVCLL
jgi:hypothetical protein